MAFSYMRKAFRPIRRDLSEHTTDFIQLTNSSSKRENLRSEKTFLPKAQKYLTVLLQWLKDPRDLSI